MERSAWLYFHIAYALKWQCIRLVEIFVAFRTGGCQNDTFQCSRWLEFHRSDDIFAFGVYQRGCCRAHSHIHILLAWLTIWWLYQIQYSDFTDLGFNVCIDLWIEQVESINHYTARRSIRLLCACWLHFWLLLLKLEAQIVAKDDRGDCHFQFRSSDSTSGNLGQYVLPCRFYSTHIPMFTVHDHLLYDLSPPIICYLVNTNMHYAFNNN